MQTPESETRIIWDDSDLRIIYAPHHSETLLLTFGDLLSGVNGFSFPADRAVRKLGYAAIGFVAKKPNWYTGPTFGAALDFARGFAERYPKRVAYGASMGGYAAIKYSRVLETSGVLTLTPQWTIDPGECGGMPNGYEKYYNAGMKGMGITDADIAGELMLIYDPAHRIDTYHVNTISALAPWAVRVHCHASDHHVARVISGTEVLRKLIAAAVMGDQKAAFGAVSSARRLSNRRKAIVLARAREKHTRLAWSALQGLGESGLTLFKRDSDFHLPAAAAFSRLGDHLNAQAVLEHLSRSTVR